MQKPKKYPHSFSTNNSPQLNVDEDELNLAQVGAALRRRMLLIAGVTATVASVAVVKAQTEPPIYQGSFQILTKPITGEGKVIANIPQAINSQEGISPPESTKEMETTVTVLQSPRVLNPVVEKLQSKYPDLSYKEIIKNLNIQIQQNNILEVQYIHPNQQQVKEVSQLLSQAYLNYSLAEIQSDVEQAIKFVNQQRQPLEARVKFWQNKLRDLRADNNLIDPDQKAQQLSTQIASLRQEQLDNRVQLEQMVAKYQDLQRELAQSSGERAANSVLSENTRYQKILDQIQQADVEITKQSAIMTEGNPMLITLKQKKANLLPLLSQEVVRVQKDFQSRIRDLSARDQSLDNKIQGLNQEVRNLANTSRNYNNVQRELQIATDALSQFTAKQQALQIEKSQKQQPWLLLDPKLALVNEPEAVSSGAIRNLLVGGVLGLLLGSGAALIVDKLSNIFYTSKELKDATRVPLLGIVPLSKELQQAQGKQRVETGKHNSFFDVFRSLYTNIMLLGSDKSIRSLVISSPGQGDGKSTVAIQLAQAAAAMGQRVLLVDANLRVPSLHQQVGLMNIQGLTDVISQDLDWNNVIERSPYEENLFVMTAGPIPPDSVRLLASRKMQDLMAILEKTFDLVIYDTPPLLGFADAYLLAANTNGIVMVAGLGQLKRTELRQTLEEIQISGTPMLGMIANKSKEALPASYNYYQQYYKQSMQVELAAEDTTNHPSQTSILSSPWRKLTGR
jgi:succinoglycan biosynthesis transport protein ExoP